MSVNQGPFVFIAVVVLGCLGLGVALVVFRTDVPALVVSVVLSCGVASLLYRILGGVSEAGFNLGGRLKMGGSAAVLLGGVWMFNYPLERQLEQIRYENRVEQFGFDFDEHADSSDGWFAIDESTGVPVEVKFTNPVTDEVDEIVQRPILAGLPFKLTSEEGNERYLVLGAAATAEQAIGYVPVRDLISAMDSIGWQPGTIYGPQRLYLTTEGELPPNMERRWGNTECRGESMPFEIEAVRFNGFADYDLRRCDAADGAEADLTSSLDNDAGELVELTIEGERRSFLIAVVGADHQNEPLWSSFLVIEMQSAR